MAIASFTVPGYLVDDQIGRGGFGVVYLARIESTGEPVAIKVLHRVVDDAEAARFAAEVQVMGTLAWHPNIVGIRDAGTVQGQPFIVMEYLRRGSLGDLLRSRGRMGWPEVRTCAIQAATALQVAHNNGLLHRDIKPDNILLADDGQAKLSDFGVTLAAARAGNLRGTTGTLAFSAPELLEGSGAAVATDVYALGATMFALLSGMPAFQRDTDESPAAMILRAYREPVPDLRTMGVSESAARVVERAMSKDPAGRPAAARDLADELQTAGSADGLPPVAVVGPGTAPSVPVGAAPAAAQGLPDQPPPQARARAQRIQRIAGGIGAVAALLIAVTFISTTDPFGGSDGENADSAAAPPAAVEDSAEVPDQGETPDQGAPDQAAPDPGEAPDVSAPTPSGVLPSPAPAPAQPALPFSVPGPGTVFGLTATPTAIAGTGSPLFASTATEVVRIQDGDMTSIPIAGATGLASSPDVLAVAVAGQELRLIDTQTLTALPVDPVEAREVVFAGGAFWAVDGEAVVRVDVDGGTTLADALPGVGDVATAGGVVWASAEDGTLAVVVAGDGSSATVTVDASIVELAVGPDGTAFLVTREGAVLTVDLAGQLGAIGGVQGARDVAVDADGQVFVQIGDAAVRVAGDGTTSPVSTSGTVDRLVHVDGRVLAGISNPPAVEILS